MPTPSNALPLTFSKRVRLFEDPQLREAVAEKGLPVSTAEVLLAVDAKERVPIMARALTERWDQQGAREALQSVGSDLGDEVFEAESAILELEDRQAPPGVTRTRAHRAGESLVAGRPRGLTRALLMSIRAENLTQSERAALRSLYRDLVLTCPRTQQANGARLSAAAARCPLERESLRSQIKCQTIPITPTGAELLLGPNTVCQARRQAAEFAQRGSR